MMSDQNALKEREKELRCLYRVQQCLLDPSLDLETVFARVLEAVGPGWQRPESTGAGIEYFGRSYRSTLYSEQAPRMEEPLRLGRQEIGRILVSDFAMPGELDLSQVFLREERDLLKSIAQLLSNFIEWRHLELLGKRLSVQDSHWQWREQFVAGMVEAFEASEYGSSEFYLGGSTERGEAGHGSDIDLYVRHLGTPEQRRRLADWLSGWSRCLSQVARARTGEHFRDGILSIRWLDAPPDLVSFPQLRRLAGGSNTPVDSPAAAPAPGSEIDVEAMVGRLLLGLSHELRNPLTVISTDLEMLEAKVPAKLRKEALDEARAAVTRMTELIADLMLFLRAESGLERPPLEEVDLAALVREQTANYSRKTSKANLVFEDRLLQPASVRLNRGLTARILQALLDNAVDYSQGTKVVIAVYDLSPDTLVLSVKDDGKGIDHIHHDKLFEQFYRLEGGRERSTGGVGLGLPLARALARAQNSRLELTSSLGVGTEVRLIFAGV